MKLQLNDNNICRVTRHAFRDTASLRSLALSNNRLTSIHQSAFRHIQPNMDHLRIAGTILQIKIVCMVIKLMRKMIN